MRAHSRVPGGAGRQPGRVPESGWWQLRLHSPLACGACLSPGDTAVAVGRVGSPKAHLQMETPGSQGGWLCAQVLMCLLGHQGRCQRKAAAREAPGLGSQIQTCPLTVGCQEGRKGAAGLRCAGKKGSWGDPACRQQEQGGCPRLGGTASPRGAAFADMMLEFTATARLSRLPAEPACGCPHRLPVCGSRVAHVKQPGAGPARHAASPDQHGAAWPGGGLSPMESGPGAARQDRRREQQCSLQACAAST